MDAAETLSRPEPSRSESDRGRSGRRQGRLEITVEQIIDNAENRPPAFWVALAWSMTAGLTMYASYYPLGFSPLAWIAVLPWLFLARVEQLPKRMLLASYLGGLAFYVPVLQWMRYGDPLMYFGWGALSFYLAAYIPIFIGLTRVGVHRLKWPLFAVAPVVWTGLEYLRGFLFTGFGWYYLGHSQVHWIELIQISDLVGAYGVSFVMMLISAAIAMQVPTRWLEKLRLIRTSLEGTPAAEPSARSRYTSLAVAAGVLALTVGYGFFRTSQAEFTAGPRVALVQGNFKAALNIPASQYEEAFVVHNELTGMAVEEQPDMIVWPEGMFRYALLQADESLSAADLAEIAPHLPPDSWRRSDVPRTLETMSEKAGAALVIGLGAYVASPEGMAQYNSAQLVTPEAGLKQRYDKLHRVPFGEYIPGQDWSMLTGVFPENFGLTAGTTATAFDYKSWRCAPVICFEDTVPHVTRNIVRTIETKSESGKPVDFLVNLSNDGWFAGSSEHDQHLITAQFRAVELRKPLVRAANMGISSCINGSGQVIDPEVFLTKDPVTWRPKEISYRDPNTGRYRRKLEAVLVQTIPLDNRGSLYLVIGDWFAATCLFACGALLIFHWWPRKKTSTPVDSAAA